MYNKLFLLRNNIHSQKCKKKCKKKIVKSTENYVFLLFFVIVGSKNQVVVEIHNKKDIIIQVF